MAEVRQRLSKYDFIRTIRPLLCYNTGMGKPHSTKQPLDRIDTERFFDLLADKLDADQFGLVAAAMAESIGRGGVARVLGNAASPRTRIAKMRKRLKSKINPVPKA